MDMKHVVVTGGAGFIGHHVVTQLLDKGHRSHALDTFSTGSLKNLMNHTPDRQLVLPFGIQVSQLYTLTDQSRANTTTNATGTTA